MKKISCAQKTSYNKMIKFTKPETCEIIILNAMMNFPANEPPRPIRLNRVKSRPLTIDLSGLNR